MDNPTHIAIEFPSYFPDNYEDIMKGGIEHETLKLQTRRREPTIWASVDWIVPGLIAVYILKPYFESFLKEAGKDHYVLLKSKINDLLAKGKAMQVKKMTASGSVDKNEPNTDTQSKAISIHIQTRKNTTIKLLFDDKLDLGTWQSMATTFLDILEKYYDDEKENPLKQYLDRIDTENTKVVYCYIDPETKTWNITNTIRTNKV